MKSILFIFFVVLFAIDRHDTCASEITGRISTNPDELSGYRQPPAVAPAKADIKSQKTANGAVIIWPNQKIQFTAKPPEQSTVKVLGLMRHPDGSLLRGQDKKIYLIQSDLKKYIANWKELNKYKGQPIDTASDEELARYQTRPHLDGELIRAKGEVKIYVIEHGAKRRIFTLSEFLVRFRGQDIYNITREELAMY